MKSETRQQWRVGSEKEQWKRESEKREKERENTDGIGRRVVNGNDGHWLFQRRLIPSSLSSTPLDPTRPGVEFRLIAAINIKPISWGHLFTLWLSLFAVSYYLYDDRFFSIKYIFCKTALREKPCIIFLFLTKIMKSMISNLWFLHFFRNKFDVVNERYKNKIRVSFLFFFLIGITPKRYCKNDCEIAVKAWGN